MFISFVKQLESFIKSRWYWLLFIVGGLSLLTVALIFQHGFGHEPCVMCIQVRLWISLWIVLSVIGLITLNSKVSNAITHVSVVFVAMALTERSYQLLGTERGFIFSDCGFSLGLPQWFAIEGMVAMVIPY